MVPVNRHKDSMAKPDPQALVGTTVTPMQARYASWTADVLVYTIVLNLFVEYTRAIVVESFTISILTAILLKAILDLLGGLEHRVSAFWKQRDGGAARVLGALSVFAILFGGKFVILEVVDVVFGDLVELGHFIEVSVLVIAMLVSRVTMDWVYQQLGEQATAHDTDGRGAA